MALARAAALLLLALLLPPALPGGLGTSQGPEAHVGWWLPRGAMADAHAQAMAQGLLGSLRAADGTIAGSHVEARWDAQGIDDWRAGGEPLLRRVALDLGGSPCPPQCWSGIAGPVALLGWPERGAAVVDAGRAGLVAWAPEGVGAELPPGAVLLHRSGDRMVWRTGNATLLLAGGGPLAVEGLAVRGPSLLALRLPEEEARAAIALPVALVGWMSVGPAPSTLWLSAFPRTEPSLGEPPSLRLDTTRPGWHALRLEVAGLAEAAWMPRQLVASIQDRELDEQRLDELGEAALLERPAVNVTLGRPAVVWVAYDAGAPLGLDLRLDLEPPRVLGWDVLNLTHDSALLRARASEHALGLLRHWPQGRPGDAIASATPQPALQMDFPLLALRPDTAYEFQLTLRDYSGNTALDEARSLRTLPKPQVPAPVILALQPPENASLAAPVEEVRVAFSNPAGSFDLRQHVRLFVDKREVTEGLAAEPGAIVYRPPRPLGPGEHTVDIILRNSAGGEVERAWRFTVQGAVPGLAPWLAALAWLGAALAARRGKP